MANEITVTGTSFDVMTPQVAQYVERYHTFLTKTVESILELGKVVFEADKELVGADKQAFCRAIKLNDQDSTYKKLKQIGSAYNELMKYKDKLPSNCVQPPCYVPVIWRFSKIVSGAGGRMRRA